MGILASKTTKPNLPSPAYLHRPTLTRSLQPERASTPEFPFVDRNGNNRYVFWVKKGKDARRIVERFGFNPDDAQRADDSKFLWVDSVFGFEAYLTPEEVERFATDDDIHYFEQSSQRVRVTLWAQTILV